MHAQVIHGSGTTTLANPERQHLEASNMKEQCSLLLLPRLPQQRRTAARQCFYSTHACNWLEFLVPQGSSRLPPLPGCMGCSDHQTHSQNCNA